MVEENKEDISDGEGGSSGSDFEAEYRKKTILKGTKNELKVNTRGLNKRAVAFSIIVRPPCREIQNQNSHGSLETLLLLIAH